MNTPARTTTMPAKPAGKGNLITKFAEKFGVDETKLMGILKATCFKQPAGKGGSAPAEVSNEQMAALLVVADQYNLNPFTREIYAFPDKGKGIVPIVGVDGWARIINEHPALDGFEFRAAAEIVQMDDDAKPCPEWLEIVIYRKDRSRPVVVREYLDECYRPAFKGQYGPVTGPWQSHTKRFLRHKTLIQGARIVFGFAGVYDEDEGERIANARVVDMTAGMPAAIDVTAVDTSAFHEKLAMRDFIIPDMEKFLAETARMNGCRIDDVKAQASENFEGFWSAFEGWRAKQHPTPTNGNGTTRNKPSKAEMEQRRADAKAELESLGVFDDVAKVMSLKGQGLWTAWNTAQCGKALEMGRELAAQTDEPAAQEPTQDEQPATEQAADPNGDVVNCPREMQTLSVKECDGCPDRNTCSEWQEV